MAEAMGERQAVLPMLPAGPGTRRLALTAVTISLVTFLATAPFAQVKLPPVPAFIVCYELAVVINNLITAVLIASQFTIARSRALLVLACGYFLTALMAAIHALTFPGLFSALGIPGALRESTLWLYVFWHAGFPLAVIAYVVLGARTDRVRLAAPLAVLLGVAATIGITVVLVALAFWGEGILPSLTRDPGPTLARVVAMATTLSIIVVALVLLWQRPKRGVLDLWLLVALVAWLADVGLSVVLNAGRFDVGFYAGRLFGLAQASFVLLMLLLETGALYQRLARSLEAERVERERRLSELQSELIHVARLSELGHMVLALAHEVNQPLNAITNYIRAGQRTIETGATAKAQPLFDKAAHQALRAGQIIDRLRSFVKNGDAVRHAEHLENVIQETVELALVGANRRIAVKPEIRLHPNATVAVIDRIQIQQVLLNLIRNAIDAMANSADRELVIATAPFGDDMIEISVADRGPGLAPEVRDRLFQPFVTTKTSGMGVGLSICRSIVEAHGGHIAARDNPGGGAVFWFCVPRAREGIDRIAAA